jgi:hypothetical protein
MKTNSNLLLFATFVTLISAFFDHLLYGQQIDAIPKLQSDDAKARILKMLEGRPPYMTLNPVYRGVVEGDPERTSFNSLPLASLLTTKGTGELPEWRALDERQKYDIAKKQINKLNAFGFNCEARVMDFGSPLNPDPGGDPLGYASIDIPETWKHRIVSILEPDFNPAFNVAEGVKTFKQVDVVRIGEKPICDILAIDFPGASGDVAYAKIRYSYTWDEDMRKFVEAFGGIRNFRQVNVIQNLSNLDGLVASKEQVFRVLFLWGGDTGWRIESFPEPVGELKLTELSAELMSGSDALEQKANQEKLAKVEKKNMAQEAEPLIAERTWTSVEGRQINAALVDITGETCVLLVRGQRLSLPISKLSAKDQALIRSKQ